MPADVRGMLHYALSMRFQSSWSLFKECLVSVVQAMPLVIEREPPLSAQAHHNALLQLLFPVGETKLVFAVKLLTATNGEWRNTDSLEYYWHSRMLPVPPPEQIKAMMWCQACWRPSLRISHTFGPVTAGQASLIR